MTQLYVEAGYVDAGYIEGAAIYAELHKLNGGAWVDLFELDLTPVGSTVFRFHAGTNGLRQPIVWQGNSYTPFPIQAEGFAMTGNGEVPRPKLSVANVSGVLTALVREYDDLVGMRVTRKRTMAKYLDAVNFAPQRNLFTQTEALSAWTTSGASVTADAAMAPTGEQVMDKLVESATTGNHYVTRTASAASAGAGTVMVLSVHARAAGRRFLALQFVANAASFTASRTCFFDLLTGTASNIPSGFSARVLPVDKDTWRCVFWGPTDGAGAVVTRYYVTTGTAGTSYTGDGTSGAYLWGAQLETGALTDYQPVLGTTFVRNPTADPYSALPDEVYFVTQKTFENRTIVEFELGSALDLQGVTLPRRQLLGNTCPWLYRGAECSYSGGAVADRFDQPTSMLANDNCSHTLAGCKLRFGQNGELSFGGFPGSGLTRQ